MKALPPIIGFVVGVTVAVGACSVLNSGRAAHREVRLRSDVHDPLRLCLDDIVQTQERGDVALAGQKAKLLQRRWSEYLNNGGRSPEMFAADVMELGSAATRPRP
jgi:hypothetical protein